LRRRMGWVGLEDKIDAAMSGPGKGFGGGPLVQMQMPGGAVGGVHGSGLGEGPVRL